MLDDALEAFCPGKDHTGFQLQACPYIGSSTAIANLLQNVQVIFLADVGALAVGCVSRM